MIESVKEAKQIVVRLSKMDLNSLPTEDQLRLMSAYMEFAEKAKPVVLKSKISDGKESFFKEILT